MLQPTLGLVWAVTVDTSRLSFPRLVLSESPHRSPLFPPDGPFFGIRTFQHNDHWLGSPPATLLLCFLRRFSPRHSKVTFKAKIAAKVKENFWLLSKNKVLHRDGNAMKILLIFFSLWEPSPCCRLSCVCLSVPPAIDSAASFMLFHMLLLLF